MLQSQKLKTIEELLLSNKDKEVSFEVWDYIERRDVMSDKYRDIIERKYKWFEKIQGVKIYNQLVWDGLFWNLCRKYFWISVFNEYIRNNRKIDTIFKIKESRIFIHSLLEFIEDEKQNHILYDEKKSREIFFKEIEHAKSEFSITEFTLHYSLKDFIWSPMKIYSILKNYRDIYEIKNIQIFSGNINFYITQIWEEKIRIEFNGEDIFINNQKIYFQDKQSFIKDYNRLLFSYFKATKKNEVTYANLKRYYLESSFNYTKIKDDKFTYEDVRKSIEEKSKEICEKHGINRSFFVIDSKSISCDLYIPEEDTLSLPSVS